MMRCFGWVVIGLSIAVIAVLSGCGGSKAPVRTNNASLLSSSGYGKVTLTVHWPERGRVIPYATEQIVARLKRNGSILFEQVIERGQTQVVFEKVPVGNWVLEAEARGTGTQAVEVKGEVIDYDTNLPVPNAQVTLMIFSPQEKTLSTTTDNSGQFNFGLVSFHFGEIKVTAQGYQEFYWPVNFGDFVTGEGITIHMRKPSSGGAPPPPPSRSKRQWLAHIILASGAASFTLDANENKQVVVELASKLKDLNVTPAQIRLAIGESVDVAVQGLIEQANEWDPNRVWLYLVELNPNKVRWQVEDISVISLSATTGLSVTLRGLREGQTTLTVRDEESGKSKEVSVQVVSARVVTIRLQTINGQPVNAEWAAFQDGDGNWQVVNPTSQGVYRLQVTDPAGRYGFAYAGENANYGSNFNIIQATVDEMPEVLVPIEPTEYFTVTGNLIGTYNRVRIVIGDSVTESHEGRYEIYVPRGVWDVVAVEMTGDETQIAQRIYIHRDLQVFGNIVHDVNFNDSSKVKNLTPTHTVSHTGGDDYITVSLITRNNYFGAELATTYGKSLSYPSVPDLLREGDLYVAEVEDVGYRWFSTPQNLTLQPLTEELSVNGNIVNNRLVISGLRYSGASWWEIFISLRLVYNDWSIKVTPGWLGGSDTYTVPDFSSLPGWNPQWGNPSDSDYFHVSVLVINRPLRDIAKINLLKGMDGLELKYQWAGGQVGGRAYKLQKRDRVGHNIFRRPFHLLPSRNIVK